MTDPLQWITIYLNGVEAAKAGNFQEAVNNFSECIDIDKENPIVFILRSSAYYGLKQYDKAMSDIYSALALDQSVAGAYEQKGLIEWTTGNLQVALADYDKAISINPNDSISFMNRGQIKRDIGNLDGALEDFTSALELDPNNTLASMCLSMCQTMKNSPEIYKRFMEDKKNN